MALTKNTKSFERHKKRARYCEICKAPENGLLDRALYKCFIIYLFIYRLTYIGLLRVWELDVCISSHLSAFYRVLVLIGMWVSDRRRALVRWNGHRTVVKNSEDYRMGGKKPSLSKCRCYICENSEWYMLLFTAKRAKRSLKVRRENEIWNTLETWARVKICGRFGHGHFGNRQFSRRHAWTRNMQSGRCGYI